MAPKHRITIGGIPAAGSIADIRHRYNKTYVLPTADRMTDVNSGKFLKRNPGLHGGCICKRKGFGRKGKGFGAIGRGFLAFK